MHRYIIRKQRIAPGYLTRIEIVDEIERDFESDGITNARDVLSELGHTFLHLAPGEQLIIHNAGDD